MKKITAILFLTVYLFSTTEAYQLLKLPLIFEHFAEHKKLDKDITFMQFLDIHYMHGSPHDADYDRDMQLPFKTCSHLNSGIQNGFVPFSISYTVPKPLIISKNKFFFTKSTFIASHYFATIWQPPKFC